MKLSRCLEEQWFCNNSVNYGFAQLTPKYGAWNLIWSNPLCWTTAFITAVVLAEAAVRSSDVSLQIVQGEGDNSPYLNPVLAKDFSHYET